MYNYAGLSLNIQTQPWSSNMRKLSYVTLVALQERLAKEKNLDPARVGLVFEPNGCLLIKHGLAWSPSFSQATFSDKEVEKHLHELLE